MLLALVLGHPAYASQLSNLQELLDDRVRCRTPEMRLRRWDEATQGPPPPDASMSRPAEAGYVDSATYPIRIHYRKSADAERAETVVLPIAEDVWTAEIEEMGWPMPPTDYGVGGSDDYDIYLTNEETQGGAWTYTTYDTGVEPDAWSDDDLFSNSSYIAIDDDESWIPDSSMPGFVSHEFNHALQYGMDANEYTLFAWESTAEAIAELYSGNGRDFKNEISDFQSHPSLSILFDSYTRQVTNYGNDTYYYEYGGWIFGAFIEQGIGTNDGSTLAQVWRDLAAGSRADEPDYVDALGMIGGTDYPDAGALFLAFSEWRMAVAENDDGAHYSDGSTWPSSAEPGLEGTVNLSEVDGKELEPESPPYYFGNSVWEITVDEASDGALHVEVGGDDTTNWGIVAIGYDAAGGTTFTRAQGVNGARVAADLPLAGVSRVLLAVANIGPSGLDPEDDSIKATNDFTVALSVEQADTAADDTAGEKDKGGVACGCATGGSAGGLGASVLVGAALLRRRGQRTVSSLAR